MSEKLHLCAHGRMWLVDGGRCSCVVLALEYFKRRGFTLPVPLKAAI